ncbi:RimJ/RimL family protein N-acetyltransferase [Bacillus tianshenii]|uniref:RimJ/RimL family protein N-acetyltransferase n=1 Tax=Sutcliffiella tianshenii TaxID=1463404 RepID=A0ABS2NWU0_9BACI|nr:GNAT family N-acetyltransferase [Bacillus tianshenii]MBM7619137.1 RimJ/RimL family protein N-acetyltransferase [Bacillus tianshenii]
MNVRKAIPEDAEKLAELIKKVEESNFMLFGPGERKVTGEQLRKNRIGPLEKDQSSNFLVAVDGEELIGYLMAIGSTTQRTAHSVYLVIGVSETARGKGVGTELFRKMVEWAKNRNLHRLELTVMIHNEAAINLYKKMGFEIEGVKKHSLFVDGTFVDELYMENFCR